MSLFVGGVLVSCATQISMPYRNKVNFIGMNQYFDIDNIVTSNDGGYMEIQATVTNSAPNSQQLYYRCVFYNTKGMQITDNVQWNPIQVFGEGKQIINCQSVNKNAIDYKIELSTTGDALQVYK